MNKNTFGFILASINNLLADMTEDNNGPVQIFMNNGQKIVVHSSTINLKDDLLVAQTEKDSFAYIPYENISYVNF